jgi:Holliday junction resolvasome RuvABC endonuclease subunit
MTQRILSIDASSMTGWATNANGPYESGRQQFPLRRGESDGMRKLRFRAWVREMLETLRPEVVVYEAPFVHPKHASSAELAYVFTGIVQMECEAVKIQYVSCPPSTLKRYATGKGNAGKPEMQEAARRNYDHYSPVADPGADEADALLLLAWGEAGFSEDQPQKKKAKKKVTA